MIKPLLILALLSSLVSAAQDTCKTQSDCRALNTCEKGLCIHKDLWEPAPSEYVGAAVIFVLSGLGAGTGLGGGPLMSPVFILIWFFSSFDAIPLAQVTILSASVTTICFRIFERNPKRNRPLIAYDLLILIQPPIVTGAVFGVLLNFMLQDWLVLILLLCLIIYAMLSSLKKARDNWKIESLAIKNTIVPIPEIELMKDTERAETIKEDTPSEESQRQKAKGTSTDINKDIESESLKEKSPGLIEIERRFAATIPWRHVLIIVATHSFVIFALLIRGGLGASSIVHITACSEAFYIWIPLFIVIMLAISVANAVYSMRLYNWYVKENYNFLPDDFRWTHKKMFKFMLIAICCGTASGMLGAGGGTTMGPILLLYGLNPSINAATSSVLVFFTSSISSLDFMLAGRIHEDYGVMIIIMCTISGATGVIFVRYIVKKYSRPSAIAFIMSLLLFLAACGIIIFGIMNTVTKAQRGLLTDKLTDICTIK